MKINIKKLIVECAVLQEGWKSALRDFGVSEDDLRQLAHKDPSNDRYFQTKTNEIIAPNKYLDALAKWYSNGDFTLNDSHVKDVLGQYESLKRKNKLKPQHKNPTQFRSYHGFSKVVDGYADENQTVRKDASGNVKYSDNIKKIYDKNGWQVWATKTFEATREFIKYLYDMDDKQLHGHGADNYEEGICPYCIMQRDYWDDHAGTDKDYTMYWILKDKKAPNIERGEGIDKVFATTDTDFELLNKKDEYFSKEELSNLPKEFWDIIYSLDYHSLDMIPVEVVPYLSENLMEDYLRGRIEKNKRLNSELYKLLPKKLKQEYLEKRIKNRDILSEHEYKDLPKDLRREYFEYRVNKDDATISPFEARDVPNDLEEALFINRIIRVSGVGIGKNEFKLFPKKYKKIYLRYRITSGDHLFSYEYKMLTPEQKKKYLDLRIEYQFRLSKEEYDDLSDDQKRDYITMLIDVYKRIPHYTLNDLKLLPEKKVKEHFLRLIREDRLIEEEYKIMPEDLKKIFFNKKIEDRERIPDYALNDLDEETANRYFSMLVGTQYNGRMTEYPHTKLDKRLQKIYVYNRGTKGAVPFLNGIPKEFWGYFATLLAKRGVKLATRDVAVLSPKDGDRYFKELEKHRGSS